jgi:hypothetical protein
MATRMQQRRGTASEWTAADPVLAAAEFGYETDTGKFKIGDGVNAWSTLEAFSDASSILGAAPATLDTLSELAAAIDNNPDFFSVVGGNTTSIANLTQDLSDTTTTLNTSISNTLASANSHTDGEILSAAATLELVDIQLQSSIDSVELEITDITTDLSALSSTVDGHTSSIDAHNLSTTNVHGIVDTSVLATASDLVALGITSLTDAENYADGLAGNYDVSGAALSAVTGHNSETTSVHGIADTSLLATTANVSSAQTAAQTYADGLASNYDAAGTAATAQSAAQSFATTEVSDHNLVTTNIHGIADTSLLVTTGGATFTGDVVLNADPSQALGAVTKQYADSISQGLHVHASVTALSTSNVDVTGSTPTTVIDGVTLVDGARVILNGQTDSADNGIYVFTATGSTFTRSSDFDEPGEIAGGDFLFVTGGTVYSDTGWVQTSDQPATIGTDPIVFTQFSGAGSITAGTNVEVTGTQVSLVADPTLSDATITNLDITNLVFADGTQTGAGVLSITPIAQKVASYELAASSEKDTLIEVDSVSATTVTIPAEASVNFPVGSTLDIIQVGTGQVTIAGASGVTVNSTPGLKLRAQWSSVTLLKRGSDSWIVFGDTSA